MLSGLLLLGFLAHVGFCKPDSHEKFLKLVDELKDQDDVDMEELMTLEEKFTEELALHKDRVVYSDIELLNEDEELDDEPSEDDAVEDDTDDDISDVPDALDWRDFGMVHTPIYQGMCGSCGFVSGTQALESRIAIASENYIPYSIQNFMNCKGRICVGAQPYSVTTQARKRDFIVPESDLPYTKRKCIYKVDDKKIKTNCYCGAKRPLEFNNTLHDQFVVIIGSGAAHSRELAIKALQDGPLTTCYDNSNKRPGEKCGRGCLHANSVIGYSKQGFIVQNSYGKHWGPFKNGTFLAPNGTICEKAVLQKAYHPVIIYDYDRANAFYTELDGVAEGELKFVDESIYGVVDYDRRNWGTAKNKCAFIGSACKGVVELSTGEYGLISDFGAGSSGPQKSFRKTQMSIYLKHEASGRYVGIGNTNGQLNLTVVDKAQAAPFYTSYGRFISFDFPTHHIVNNTLQPVTGTVREIALNFDLNLNITNDHWHLTHCNIHNLQSGMSLDLAYKEVGKKKRKQTWISLTTANFNGTSNSQRFELGISRKWDLISEVTGSELFRSKNDGFLFSPMSKSYRTMEFMWQQRRVFRTRGGLLGPDALLHPGLNYTDTTKIWNPTDCSITNKDAMGVNRFLVVNNGDLVMSGEAGEKQGWTFEYADL